MTLQKPVNQAKSQPDAQAVPYPTTPSALDQEVWSEPEFCLGDLKEGRFGPGYGTNPWRTSNENSWDSSHGKVVKDELPPTSNPGGGRQLAGDVKKQGTPQILQAGSGGKDPRFSWQSQESESTNTAPSAPKPAPTGAAPLPHAAIESTNPYHRTQNGAAKATDEAYYETENSADIWGTAPSISHASQEPPLLKHPFAEPWTKFETSPIEQGQSGVETVRKPSINPWTIDPPEAASTGTTNYLKEGRAIEAPAFSEVETEASNAPVQQVESTKPKRAVETYQIRKIYWLDASSSFIRRRSPIMVQNANGPCPLVALVNALVLSTPADYNTALVEHLSIRDQVSLGLLLGPVLEELLWRMGDLSHPSDIYAFLLTLHTGMNANPIFVPKGNPVNPMDSPLEGNTSAPTHEFRQPGGFEETYEMKLYNRFSIPLIHGWLPPRDHPAFAALERTARTYEDAQNLMFKEEELEEKLQRQGLSSEEQVTLEDIASVKYFLSSTATQLTKYGLDIMTESMALGSVAILFRNNHFSTLYRHHTSGQLLTLVTDMGYAGHDEVVWESLVDVNGEGSEFFSGDFRPVSHDIDDTQQQSQYQNDEGWTTVNNRSRRPATANQQSSETDPPCLCSLNINDNVNQPPPTTTEQQDHDLALAMHLQDQEEERDRQEAAARRRHEDELSQRYLNNSDASGRRTFPGFSAGATAAQSGPSPLPRGRGSGAVRGSSGRGAPSSRPTPRKPIEADDAPPPTYEQAAKGPAYHPPPSQSPTSPNASGSAAQRPPPQPNRAKKTSAYAQNAASHGAPSSPSSFSGGTRGGMSRGAGRGGRGDVGRARRMMGGTGVEEEKKEKEKDCVVM